MEYGTPWTSIANLALAKLGRPPIGDLGEKGGYGSPAVTVRAQLPITVSEVLGGRAWRCLTKGVSLNRLRAVPPDRKYRYQVPGDFVRLVHVQTKPGTDYKLRGNYIDSDSEEVVLDYVAVPSDPMIVPSFIQNLLAFHLAVYIAPLMNADVNLQQALASEYLEAQHSAWMMDNADVPDVIYGAGVEEKLKRTRGI